MTTAEKVKKIKQEEFNYCKKNLLYWIDNYCPIEDKDLPEVIVPFTAWEAQRELIESITHNRLNIVLKARQLGVTWIALYICTHDLIFNGGHTVIALSKTEEDAKELVRRAKVILDYQTELLEGGDITYSPTTMQISVYSGGLTSVFKSFASSESAGRSFTANILLLDEWAFQQYAREIWQSAYPTINRPTGGKVIGLSTIKRGTLFEDIWVQDNNFNKLFLSVFADPNRTQAWYEQAKKDLGELVKQEYPRTAEEALSNIGGSYFNEFDPSVHIIEPFDIPDHWKWYTSMDYGLDKLAHYWIAIDTQQNIYVTKEIYESDLIVSDAVAKIKSLETVRGYVGRIAPPDLWNRQSLTGKSTALLFIEQGLSLRESNNDRVSGWMALKELLKVTTKLNEAGEEVKTSRLKIFRNCVNLIRTLPQVQRDEKRPNDVATEPHELTHAPDALRYFAVAWTSKASELEREKPLRAIDRLKQMGVRRC